MGWFLPKTPDVLAMLGEQASVTLSGMQAFTSWARGDSKAAGAVRDAEHRADDSKRVLRKALTLAFTTPIDAEDIYVMSERLDAVLNGAKDAVREAEVMAVSPDPPIGEMADLLAAGVRHLTQAFGRLGDSKPAERAEATESADLAVKTQRHLERIYRKAMSALVEEDDLRLVMSRSELYRRLSRMSADLVEVADRVWYALVKEA